MQKRMLWFKERPTLVLLRQVAVACMSDPLVTTTSDMATNRIWLQGRLNKSD